MRRVGLIGAEARASSVRSPPGGSRSDDGHHLLERHDSLARWRSARGAPGELDDAGSAATICPSTRSSRALGGLDGDHEAAGAGPEHSTMSAKHDEHDQHDGRGHAETACGERLPRPRRGGCGGGPLRRASGFGLRGAGFWPPAEVDGPVDLALRRGGSVRPVGGRRRVLGSRLVVGVRHRSASCGAEIARPRPAPADIRWPVAPSG